MKAAELAEAVREARGRSLDLVRDLSDEQLMGPRLAIVNPLRWEIGHLAWFQEKWLLRRDGGPSLLPQADALYDSMAIPHDVRWDLPLLSREETVAYMERVRDRVVDRLTAGPVSAADRYFTLLSVFHEDMHDEAFTYTRQTLEYPAPRFRDAPAPPPAGPHPGDARVAGGTLLLGADPGEPFVFDNEKWAHPVQVAPFAIARAAVTQEEFARFVEDGGYRRPELWTPEGEAWRARAGAVGHRYWRRAPDSEAWLRRDFDRWVPLEPHRPVLHVNCHEAEAYCRWAGRRLPTEAEWEMAALWDPDAGRKRRFPWGDEPPSPDRASLDWRGMGCPDVAALPAGDSPCGCRQMIGGVWEWTATAFGPYPGFAADPYREYSEPWFGTHRVLRGGCWVTRSRLIRGTWRNFYTPDRGDVWAGFRTCAVE